jgi:hypothetical protein
LINQKEFQPVKDRNDRTENVALQVNRSTRLPNIEIEDAQSGNHNAGTAQDVFARFNRRNDAVHRDAEKRAEATEMEFIEESLNRGFGVRPVVPIRSEQLKAKAYQLGFAFAMMLAFVLGAINANQVIDETNIQLPLAFEFILIALVVGVSLLGFEFVSKAILTAVLDLSSFRNTGARTIRRWFIYLGLAFAFAGLVSLWLRADTGLPELLGIIFFMIWEWITVAIAALCSLAYGYHGWSGDLARQYEEAVTIGYAF